MVKDRFSELQQQMNADGKKKSSPVLRLKVMAKKDHEEDSQDEDKRGGDSSPTSTFRSKIFRSSKKKKDKEQDEKDAEASVSLFKSKDSTKRKSIDIFLDQVADLDTQIAQMNTDILQLKKLQSEALSIPSCSSGTSDSYETKKQKLESLSIQIRKTSRNILTKLQDMEKELKAQSQDETTSTDNRIKSIHYAALTKKLGDSLSQFNNFQTEYSEKCKDRFRRQLEVTGHPLVDDHELDTLLESESPAIFTQNFVQQTLQAKRDLEDIKARHDELRKLEQSILEMHQMFQDIAILVQTQGEKIDCIQFNILKAADAAKSGKTQIQEAKKKKFKAMKRKVICYAIGGVVLVIFIGALPFI